MVAALSLLGFALAASFYGVLEMRFADGGAYPHYASYRFDPLGTSVFYEALDEFEGMEVSRNVTDLMGVRGLDDDSALLLLGYPRDGIDDLRAPADSPVMKAVEEGARLVLTLNPGLVPEVYQPERSALEDDWIERRRRIREVREENPEKEEKEEKEDGQTVEKEKAEEEESELSDEEEEREFEARMDEALGQRLTRKLAFEVTNPPFERPEEGWETEVGESLSGTGGAWEPPMWRSQFRLEAKDPAWKEVLLVEGVPVVMERSFGKGSVVVATDTYFASNESLHSGGEPRFLLWLLAGKSKVVFDETIHGSRESGGAMKMIRRHRAHGVFLGLILFFVLWIWRNASPLVVGTESSDRGLRDGEGAVMGEEAGTGLVRLLRRSVPPSSLMERCLEVWNDSKGAALPSSLREKARLLVARHRKEPKKFDAPGTYRSIADLVRRR